MSSGRGRWPYAPVSTDELPPTLPDGTPWPRISVITPSYNQGPYIEETILSVVNQKYPDVEHIVIDGGSTDETVSLLEAHGDHLAYFVSEPDRGQSEAINKGFARATGEILTWLNSDDVFAPGALFAAALAFHTAGSDMVAGVVELYRDGVHEGRHITSCGDGPLPLDDLLDLDNCWNVGQFFYQPEVLFTRQIWERAGGYVDESWFYSMDYELWVRFAHAGATIHVIGKPIVWFRLHENQKTAVQTGFKDELPKVREAFLARTGYAFHRPAPVVRRNRLRIALVNDLGYNYGAGIGHRRLAQALQTGGHKLAVLGLREPGQPSTAQEDLHEGALKWLRAARPDLVVFGNLHAAHVDADLVGRVAREYPTIHLLHDLWLVTGWCAYPSTCAQYLTGCSDACQCPYDYPTYVPEGISDAWRLRRGVLHGATPPVLVPNSQWTGRRIQEALSMGDNDAAVGLVAPPFRFGFELETFRPRDPALCRELLDLPQDRFIIMTSASSMRDPRKGITLLRDALERLQLPDTLVISPGNIEAEAELPIPEMRPFGYVRDPRQLALMLSSADLFVGPSVEEAFGMVFVEAAACGTPSIGFRVGGVPEAVADGISGTLVDDISADSLASAIKELYLDADRRQFLGRCARLWAENEWSMEGSAYRFARILWDSGMAERLGLSRKIYLTDSTAPPAEAEFLGQELSLATIFRNRESMRLGLWQLAAQAWRSIPLGVRVRLRESITKRLGATIRPPWVEDHNR